MECGSRLRKSPACDRVNLDLKTVDLCFLAGLYLRANKGALASFEEHMLVDMFEQVCDVVEPGADNPRKRATHAIQRLREQRDRLVLRGQAETQSAWPKATQKGLACVAASSCLAGFSSASITM
jgi:hypothetical protein